MRTVGTPCCLYPWR